MSTTRRARLAIVLLLLWPAACVTSRPSQHRNRTPHTDSVQPPAISLPGRSVLATAASEKLRADLAAARRALAADPSDPDKLIWVGRRLGYLWRMNRAIQVFSHGIELHPGYAPLYRHRGHRYISLRRFGDAIADLEQAAELIRGQPDVVEPDGAPNEQGIPLTTTGFNVWYHLGLARYLTRDFEGAVSAFREAQELGRGFDDNLVATTDWMYLALRRLGQEHEAAALLTRIGPDMDIIENHAYHRRLLMYKRSVAPDELLDRTKASELDLATLGYGLGSWYLCNGDLERAYATFRRVTSGPYWPAFGFIASEVELAAQVKIDVEKR